MTHRIALAAARLAVLLAVLPLHASRADEPTSRDDLGALQRQVEQLLRDNAAMRETVDALRQEVKQARDEALAAQDTAANVAEDRALALADVSAGLAPPPEEAGIVAQRVGPANLRLIDISLDTLFAAGSSTASNEDLETLQGGGHDPRQRGFTLQNVELSFFGAVDPYLTGEAHLIYFLDSEGESVFEIEEAFVTSQMLPFHLEEYGFELEAGQFFTEFGRINPRHPHNWDWQDQPVVSSRFFGPDGMRGPGLRVGWLAPLPWFSELHVGIQNAAGETMVSFLGNDESFEEGFVGGRPFADRKVNGWNDFVYLTRWVNGFDVSETLSAQWGISGLFGPNGTGDDGTTRIYGTDLVVKWLPLQTDRGWPFVTWQSEFMYRDYHADAYAGCAEPEGDCDPIALGSDDLDDWGFYTQLLWGFRRNWSAGIRYEYATGSGASFDAAEDMAVPRSDDPYRSNRHRLSPLLTFHPSEFSRLRLQYNWDHVTYLPDDDYHSVWAGVEFLIGSHAAHGY